MQGLRSRFVSLDLIPSSSSAASASTATLSIDISESAETRINRLISEHPVVIFSRSACCMCHVMKNLLSAVGVHPAVIELDDVELSALPRHLDSADSDSGESPVNSRTPAVFIGGTCVGGLEDLFALHLSGHLVPKLVEVGALSGYEYE